ncbi:MAG TPA: RHS repeat-associated core domain-containing protein [Candidatus Acidoferrales bacterium]
MKSTIGCLPALDLGSRGAPCGDSFADTANIGNVLDFSYNFSLGSADNGNVTGIANNRDTTRSQSFTYDALNRIATAATASTYATSPAYCWGEAFSYDAWGDLQMIGGASSAYTDCTQESLTVSATTKNQVSGYGYDAAGNMTSIPSVASYAYNTEGQMTSAAGVTYTGACPERSRGNGDGKRVSKSNGKLYWYGMGSSTLDESDASGNITNEYVFFAGKRIARRDSSNNVSYYFADHLGTARVVTNASGAILDDSDFYPFGGERPIVSSSGNTYKFTSKERDSESGLDDFGARYYSSALGRFVSSDWSAIPVPVPYAKFLDPQTLNLYTYVRNLPTTSTDLDGHMLVGFTESGAPFGPGTPPNSGMEFGSGSGGSEEKSDPLLALSALLALGTPADPEVALQEAQQQPQQQSQPTSGEGSQPNLDRRAAIAAAAQAHDGDTSMPYTPGHPTCNLFLQKVVAESGAPKPEVTKADGTKGAPGAAEWAGSKIPNFRILKPGEKPQPGDTAAYKLPGHADYTGHSGIVVSVGKNGVVVAMAAHETVIGPDYKFQPNVATYQRYIGQ